MAYSTDEKGLDIGFLCHGWKPDVGGVETHTHDLARALIERGHRVHVLCLDYTQGRAPYSVTEARVEGVRVRRMAYLYQDQRSLADMVDNWRARDVLFAWLAERPLDVVHVHHLTGWGTGALKALGEVGLPCVMTLHDYWSLCPRGQMLRTDGVVCEAPEPEACGACIAGTWPHLMPSGEGDFRKPESGLAKDDAEAAAARTAYALRCLEVPHRLVTPSEAARQVYARAGVPAERIRVCENGVATAAITAAVGRLRAEGVRPIGSRGEVRLGVLGSVLPSKGVLELARAFQKAAVSGLTLEVHGNLPAYHGDPSYPQALIDLAREDTRVRLHGPYQVNGLAQILAGLDGVAAPSRWEEVFGLTVREASAAGLPVLVSDVGDLPAVTADGRRGIVVPADDEDAWVEALRRFGSDPELRASLATGAPAVRSTEAMMRELERLYVGVVREVTQLEPLLVHPVEDGPAEEREAPSEGGFLRRLLGRG